MALQLYNPELFDPHSPEAAARAEGALLIVNADDWGGMRSGTDAIERCFEAGAVSSTSGMVFMADSERARDIAIVGGRPVGLHVNITQAYERGPESVRERQLRAIPHFENLRWMRWRGSPRPSVRRLMRDVVADQLEEFRRLYGHDPTHVDSHNHAHVCPDLMLALPRDLPVRQTMSPDPGHRSLPRAVKHRYMARRFETTDALWSLPNVHPDLGGEGLGEALDRAWSGSVEIACHPSFDDELAVLLGDGWRETLRNRPLGDYRDLRA